MLEKSLIYFDNAATTFKPNQVINSVIDYYSNYTANAHREIMILVMKLILSMKA